MSISQPDHFSRQFTHIKRILFFIIREFSLRNIELDLVKKFPLSKSILHATNNATSLSAVHDRCRRWIITISGIRFAIARNDETRIVKALFSYYDNKNREANTRVCALCDISCPCPVLFTGGAVRGFTLKRFRVEQVALSG